jgi:hypothetical protein
VSATLAELARVLDQVAEFVAAGREAFDTDPRQRWSIERLWIYAGNLAEAHCREHGVEDGVEPWAELIGLRHVYAHYTPHQIVPDRVWDDTVEGVGRLQRVVNAVRS